MFFALTTNYSSIINIKCKLCVMIKKFISFNRKNLESIEIYLNQEQFLESRILFLIQENYFL